MVRNERGFTLIELLVTITLVGILSAMSVLIYDEYRARAYDGTVARQLQDTVLALEAGRGQIDAAAGGWYSLWVDPVGGRWGMNDAQLLPGLSITDGITLSAWYNPGCETGGWCPRGILCCAVTSVWVRHCQSHKAMQRTEFNDGTIVSFEWINWRGGC